MGEYYNTQQRIPRRRSATPDAVAQRETQIGSVQPTRTRQTDEDDNGYTSSPMRPMQRRFDHAPLTTASPERQYVIPLSDGTDIYVTERKLVTMPKAYRQAARLVRPAPPKLQAPVPQPQEQHTDDLPRQPRRRLPRFHWLVWVGLVMLLMIGGWIVLSSFASWCQVTLDDWHYGRPRTYQTDAVVGHNDSPTNPTHFIAINLNRHIEVIEMPGGDPAKSIIYVGPTLIGPGDDLAPVTLSFEDANGNGHPNLVIHVGDSKFIYLNKLVNGVWKFVPPPNQ